MLQNKRGMKILVLGGTLFAGRHLAERAIERGHELTLFNRGRQNSDLFAGQVALLRGDRDGDLSALYGREFDAVIDTCGYYPAQMRAITRALGAVPYYLFLSSISVYGRFPPGRAFDETTSVSKGGADGEADEDADRNADYGTRKARCEAVLEAAWPGRVAHVRPGLIVGPHDYTGRFTYWPQRIAQGGTVLAPGQPDNPVQWIDMRDLADWCIHLCEQSTTGVFNAVGPSSTTTFGHLLERCREVTGSNARMVWVDDQTLLDNDISPWTELPLWLPQTDPEVGGMMRANNQKALACGLTFRPLDDTIAATLAWDRTQTLPLPDNPRRVKTLTPEREAVLLNLKSAHLMA